jgi:hypothetical protein
VTQLFKLPDFPNEVAVSKTDQYMDGGAFLLDFSRPLKVNRWFGVSRRLGVRNRWIGIVTDVFVPVVHQGEAKGGYIIAIARSDPQFVKLRALLKEHYGWQKPPPTTPAGGLKIIADFATQFPNDC